MSTEKKTKIEHSEIGAGLVIGPELLDQIPYAKFLGIRVAPSLHEDDEVPDSGPPRVTLMMAQGEHLVGDSTIPALHGGTVAALLEAAAIGQVVATRKRFPKSISVSIDYLRSARPVDTFARATLIREGRRVIVASSEAYQMENGTKRLVATASVHLLVE